MKKKLSRHQLITWLKSATGVTLLSISMSNDVSKLITNTTSPHFFATAMQNKLESFPKGQYLVEYTYSLNDEEHEDVPYSRTVYALAYDANLYNGDKILNLSVLLSELGSFEYIISHRNDTDAYKLYSIIVKQPENPLELEGLIATLNKHASFVAIEDGSGYITAANSFVNGGRFI